VLFGQSAHFSGDGFSDMQFQVKSVMPAEFAAWADTVRSTGPVLDTQAYSGLARQSQKVTPFTYRSVDPQLFQAISTQRIAPGPGPEPETSMQTGREGAGEGR
jgi:cytochrome o ubiquinol oxidase subunit 2